jgi:hypothetical protein
VKTNRVRLSFVKEVAFNGFPDIPAKAFPVVCLRKDALRKAFRNKATVCFLRHFENQFAHIGNLHRTILPGNGRYRSLHALGTTQRILGYKIQKFKIEPKKYST